MFNGTLQYPVYKNDRHLTPKEKDNILSKRATYKSNISHSYNFIKMNSSYMECVNNSFFLKGNSYFNLLGVFFVAVPVILIVWLIFFYITVIRDDESLLAFIVVFSPMHILFSFIFYIFYKGYQNFKKYEKLGYNYYPIRFNRINQKVYVYDVSGQIFIGDWNKIDFILNSRLGGYEGTFWEVKGFIKDNKDLIVYTFAFALSKNKKQETLEIWEFIKEYMNNGPEKLYFNKKVAGVIYRLPAEKLSYCLNIEAHPESLETSKEIVALDYQSEIRSFYSRAMIKILGNTRNKFIRADKQPKWPQNVEDECQVDTKDPYIVDASTTYQLDTFVKIIK
ncbi:DUF6708 domain-containing protein [Acinetobacter guillouiae]|uniref:DUF6708 domain-containing protein n=1 Tax=Acinetobacter guillouiae TaxID=106649 RepID=UPI000BBCD28C|nr:DUF6708 domain-containing protein [Acinetobacter guillouiae]